MPGSHWTDVDLAQSMINGEERERRKLEERVAHLERRVETLNAVLLRMCEVLDPGQPKKAAASPLSE